MNMIELTLEKLKRNAKRLAKEKDISHCQALDILATQLGQKNWSQFHKEAMKALREEAHEHRHGGQTLEVKLDKVASIELPPNFL